MQKKDIKSHEGRLSASNGTTRIDDAALHSGLKFDTILAEQATDVTTCTGVNEAGVVIDLKAVYNWTSFVVGVPYFTPHGVIITDLQLTSGAVACY